MQLQWRATKRCATSRFILAASIGVSAVLGVSSRSSAEGGSNPLRDCLSGLEKPRLAVQFLVDESSSLGGTHPDREGSDPKGERVTAMKTALSALMFNATRMNEQGEQTQVEIDVLLAGFANSYAVRSDAWVSLTEDTFPQLAEVIEGFRKRNTGHRTNYEAALVGAEKEFVRYSRKRTESSCKALIWLTDGNLDLGGQGPEKKQRSRLCEVEDSVVNRLRSQSIFVIGLGLSYSKEPDFSLMEGIVGGGCGSREAFGQFTKVSGIDELSSEMFKNLTPGAEPSDIQPCAGEEANTECREVRFVARFPLTRVNALIGIPPGLESASVVNPAGQSVDFLDAERVIEVSEGFLRSRPTFDSSTVLTIDVAESPGDWSIQFRGPNASDALVIPVFFSDVVAVVESQPIRMNRLDPVPIIVNVGKSSLDGLDTAESVSDFDVPPTVVAVLKAGDRSIEGTVQQMGGIRRTFSVSFDQGALESIPANVNLVVTPVVKLNGRSINFDAQSFPVLLRFGTGFPVVKQVVAGPIDGSAFSTLDILIEGPVEGIGRAKIIPDSLKVEVVPAGRDVTAAQLSIDELSPSEFPAGQSGALRARLDPGFSANGRFEGKIDIEFFNSDNERQVATVSFGFDMTKPFDVAELLWVLLAMLAMFILVQAAALYLAADRLSRIGNVPRKTWYATMTVRISADKPLELVNPSSWDAVVTDATQPVSVDKVSGSRAESFGAFKIHGSPRMALRSLVLGSDMGLLVERPGSLTVSTKGHAAGHSAAGVIHSDLAGRWAMAIPLSSRGAFDTQGGVGTPKDHLLLDPESDFGFGVPGGATGVSVTVEVLFFVKDFQDVDSYDTYSDVTKIRDALDLADLWQRARDGFAEFIPNNPETVAKSSGDGGRQGAVEGDSTGPTTDSFFAGGYDASRDG